MKSHIDIKTAKMPEGYLISIVKQEFREFLSFINYPNFEFPSNIDLKFFNGFMEKGLPNGQLYVPSNDNENYTLTFEQHLCGSKHKEVLFHEFTHVMDYVVINNSISFNEKLQKIQFISESRATYIEYLIRANLSYSNHLIKLNEASEVHSAFHFADLPLSNEINLYIEHINNLISQHTEYNAGNFHNTLKQISYFIGFIKFIENNSNIKIDISTQINSLTKLCGNAIIKFIDLKELIPISFEPFKTNLINQVSEIENMMKNFYINKFIY